MPRKWFPFDKRETALLLFIVGAAALLRFAYLTEKSFWFDEGYSVEAARLPWTQLGMLMWKREGNMALYYVLLHEWLHLGASEFLVRGFSALIGVATIPVIFSLGRELFDARTGWIAASLLAVNAYHVRYSQEARSYSMVTFLACLACWFFARGVNRGGRRIWRGYTAASVLMVYSHVFGLLVVASRWTSLLFLREKEWSRKEFARATVAFLIFAVPLVAWMVTVGRTPVAWIPRTTFNGIVSWFVAFSGNGSYPLAAVYGCAFILAAYHTWLSRTRSDRETHWAYRFLWTWLLLPLIIVLIVSIVRPVFLARYLIVSLPAFVLLAAAGIAQSRPPVARYGLFAGAVILSLSGVQSYFRHDFDLNRDDWRDATQFLLAHARSTDGVFFYTEPGRMSYEYYRSLAPPDAPAPSVLMPAHAATLNYEDFIPHPVAEELSNVSARPARVWLVLDQVETPSGPDRSSTFIRDWLRRDYSETAAQSFSGIEIIQLDRRASATEAHAGL